MEHQNKSPTKRVLTEKETAEYIGMSRSFLRQARMNGDRKNRTPSPPYLRIGKRAIRYEISSLNSWLEQFRNEPASGNHTEIVTPENQADQK